MTDKEINPSQREEEAQETQKSFFVGKEKHTIAIFLVLLAILAVKSILLDEVKNLTPEEAQFKTFVEYSLEEDYGGFFTDTHLMAYRVYKIEMEDAAAKGVLRYEDPYTGKQVEIVQKGRYSGSVRGYLFSILPIKHFSITSQILESQE